MALSFKHTIQGITVAYGDEPEPLKPAPDTPQDSPRACYVYAHVTMDGQYFYIGKGSGRRAWNDDRYPTWYRYVDKHLNGQYRVVILQDNLSPEEAEELEAEWMAQEGGTLVNWINTGRQIDLEKLARFHRLRNANRELIAKGKTLEKTDVEAAIACYREAVAAINAYETIDYESGIVGQLLREERAEFGSQGEWQAIERLGFCLTKLGRAEEANAAAKDYFDRYALDRKLGCYERIMKRIDKALLKHRAKPNST